MSKYFGSSGAEPPPASDPFDQYRQRAEEWVKRHPGPALGLGLLAAVLVLRSPGLRKAAIPLVMIAARRMFMK